VKFERENEAHTVRFDVEPAANAAQGEFHVKAVASLNGQDFSARPSVDSSTRTSGASTFTTRPM
jgi:hypothetical protein